MRLMADVVIATEPEKPKQTLHMLRALRSRNYRLFFAGNLVSLVGNWLTTTATGWLVFRLTGSSAKLGIIGFCSQFPTFLLSPFAGVLVDRWKLRRAIVGTQTAAMIQSFLLAALVLSNSATFVYLLLLSLAQGVINAIDIPARQAFVVQMLEDRADLPNAIALNSSIVNAARLLGPTAAGLIIAGMKHNGEGWCYLIDGISYIFVIIALLMMTIRAAPPPPLRTPVIEALKEGFGASFGFPPIRAVLLLLSTVSIAGVPYMVLMPVFAKDILGGSEKLFGILSSAAGGGALCGAIYLAQRKSVRGMGKVLVAASATFGATLIVFAHSTHMWLSICLLPICGFSMIVQMAGSNTLLQTLADDDKRGRIMAMFAMCFMGTVPIGSLLSGTLAQNIGPQWTVTLGGAACILGAAMFYLKLERLRPHIIPIYVKRGIMPAVEGVEEATVASEHVTG